jgi:hypothetical protein
LSINHEHTQKVAQRKRKTLPSGNCQKGKEAEKEIQAMSLDQNQVYEDADELTEAGPSNSS